MKLNNYESDELVRIELLQYPNTGNLHPVEEAWRNLARKLLSDVVKLEKALCDHKAHTFTDGEKCFTCHLEGKLPRKFPEAFKEV